MHLDRVTRRAGIAAVRERLGRAASFTRSRLAYREVAAATNRLTLIAAILPAHTISVHTVFCLRTPLAADEQDVLCALLNSFVANYLVRRWVTTHVTASIVERLPVPRPERGTRQFTELARDAARLRDGEYDGDLVSAVQARAARAYGVSADDFAYILDSFPLVPADERASGAPRVLYMNAAMKALLSRHRTMVFRATNSQSRLRTKSMSDTTTLATGVRRRTKIPATSSA